MSADQANWTYTGLYTQRAEIPWKENTEGGALWRALGGALWASDELKDKDRDRPLPCG